MPYRVPGGNLVGRIIGLGNLDKLERERNMRRAYMRYDRPMYTATDRRERQCFNDRRDPLRMPLSRYPHHEPFIGDGLTPNMDVRRRRAEAIGLYHPGMDQVAPPRCPRQLDVDDWSHERVMNYLYDHEEGIQRYKGFMRRYKPEFRRHHSAKWWVRHYHDYILELQEEYEHRSMQRDQRHHGHGEGLYRGWRGEDDQEDEEDE